MHAKINISYYAVKSYSSIMKLYNNKNHEFKYEGKNFHRTI